MELNDVLGWAASVLLFATIVTQIAKQIRSRSAEGVSIYMFAGQIISSFGLAIYSFNLENWVFTFLNTLLLGTNIVGFYFTQKFKKEKAEGTP